MTSSFHDRASNSAPCQSCIRSPRSRADRGRHRAGVGVDPGEHRLAVADQEAVLVAGFAAATSAYHMPPSSGAIAVVSSDQLVERAGQEDRLRIRRPHPEGDTGVMDDGPPSPGAELRSPWLFPSIADSPACRGAGAPDRSIRSVVHFAHRRQSCWRKHGAKVRCAHAGP